MINRFLVWTSILLLIGYGLFTHLRLVKTEQTLAGLSMILLITSPEAKDFVTAIAPAVQIKDKELRGRVVSRKINERYNVNMEELLGYTAAKAN